MPVTILLQQRILTRGQGRVFPHNHRSVSAAFTRACNKLKIEDLHFHDLRHEGTSRLFEAGLTIEKVALVLLRQKFIRTCRAVEARQHGHRGKCLTRASMMRRRTVAIEFGT